MHFLGFRDGELTSQLAAAAARVAPLVRERPGHVLLVPYEGDTTADGAKVEEITREGVIMNSGGNRFLLSRE